MAEALREPCPNCGKPVEGHVTGWLKKSTRFPAYCGNCGAKLFPVCPNCKQVLIHLTTFCSHCRRQLYKPVKSNDATVVPIKAPQDRKLKVPDKVKRLLRKTWSDVNDTCLFWREEYHVVVWLNPIQVQVKQFSESLQWIDEKATGEERADIIDKTLTEINLEDNKASADYEQSVWDFTRDILFLWHDALVKVLPDYAMRLSTLPDPTKRGEQFRASLSEALRSKNDDLQIMISMLNQIREGCPEFRSIISRTGWLDSLVEGLAWATGHPFIAIMKGLSCEFTQKSDEEFINAYSKTIDDFIGFSNQRSEAIENAVDKVVLQVLTYVRQLSQACLQGVATLATSGLDVALIITTLGFYAGPDSDEEKDFNEHILTSLRDKHLVDLRAEQNLRSLLGIA